MNPALLLSVAALVCGTSPPAPTSVTSVTVELAVQDVDVRALGKRIAKERDKVDPTVFEELAQAGTTEALDALLDGLGRLKKDATRAALFRALHHFGARGELGAKAIPVLVEGALGEGTAPAAAASSLAAFGTRALEPLEQVARESGDPEARRIACDPLVPMLGNRKEDAAVALILDAAVPHHETEQVYLGITAREAETFVPWTHAKVVRRALSLHDSPGARTAMIAKLQDAESPRGWKLLLLDVLVDVEGEDVDQAITALLSDQDTAIALEALVAVRARGGEWESIEPRLRPLMRHEDISVRRAAVEQMGHFGVTEAAWREEALGLARSKDASLRMGAASALAEIRTPEAMEALHELLADRQWSVRVEALQQVARLRKKESVPILIERMKVETGRFHDDAYLALRMLTGVDQGRTTERWQRWWDGEGAAFELPSYQAAVRAEQERRQREATGDTRAARYFGVHVASQRVVFVLDISGSMRLPSGITPKDAGEVELTQKTRMDVAKTELMNVVRNIPDDALFNIVFFESRVTSLEKKLVRMKKNTRQKALRFVAEQYAVGSTALYPALELAFRDPLVDTIYLLSDGAPTEGEITDIAEIRAEVRRWNSARHVRIHGVSMGQDSDLLRWLCEDTGGRYLRVD